MANLNNFAHTQKYECPKASENTKKWPKKPQVWANLLKLSPFMRHLSRPKTNNLRVQLPLRHAFVTRSGLYQEFVNFNVHFGIRPMRAKKENLFK